MSADISYMGGKGKFLFVFYLSFYLIYQKIIALAPFSHCADEYSDLRLHKYSKKSRVLPAPSCLQKAEMQHVSY